MTAEQVEVINYKVIQAIADEKAQIVGKKKARKAAIAATAAAKILLVEPVLEADTVVASTPAPETGDGTAV
jgi:hypothetical protein